MVSELKILHKTNQVYLFSNIITLIKNGLKNYLTLVNKFLVFILLCIIGIYNPVFSKENSKHTFFQNTKDIEILPSTLTIKNNILKQKPKNSYHLTNYYVTSRQTEFSENLQTKLDLLVHDFAQGKTEVSYTIYNIPTKELLQFQGDNPGTAASSFKTYLAAYIFYLIENNKESGISIDQIADSANCEKLKDYIVNVYKKNPKKKLSELKHYAKLLKNIDLCKMLFVSDNNATKKLIELLPEGLGGLNNFMYNTLGMKHSFISCWKNLKTKNINKINLKYGYANTLTTNDQVKAWKKIFIQKTIIKESKLLNKLIDLLSYSYIHPLNQNIQESNYIISKHGMISSDFWGGRNPHVCFNDGGIIFGNKRYPKYLIQIQITDPPTIGIASEFISNFNETVWNYLNFTKLFPQKYVTSSYDTENPLNSKFRNLFNLNNHVPRAISAKSTSGKNIDIEFNKAITKTTAENKNNYSIQNLEILNLKLNKDWKTVSIITSKQCDTIYSVKVRNIQDIEGNSMDLAQRLTFVGIKEKNAFFPGLYLKNSYYQMEYGSIINYLYQNRLEGSIGYSFTEYDFTKNGFGLKKNELDIELGYWLIRKELTKSNGLNIGLWLRFGIDNFQINNRKIAEAKHIFYGFCGNYNYRVNKNWYIKPNLKVGYFSYKVNDYDLEDNFLFNKSENLYFYEYGLTFYYKINGNSLFVKFVQSDEYQPLLNFDNKFKSKKFTIGLKLIE